MLGIGLYTCLLLASRIVFCDNFCSNRPTSHAVLLGVVVGTAGDDFHTCDKLESILTRSSVLLCVAVSCMTARNVCRVHGIMAASRIIFGG